MAVQFKNDYFSLEEYLSMNKALIESQETSRKEAVDQNPNFDGLGRFVFLQLILQRRLIRSSRSRMNGTSSIK